MNPVGKSTFADKSGRVRRGFSTSAVDFAPPFARKRRRADGADAAAQGVCGGIDNNVGRIDIRGEMSKNPTEFWILLQNSSRLSLDFRAPGRHARARARIEWREGARA